MILSAEWGDGAARLAAQAGTKPLQGTTLALCSLPGVHAWEVNIMRVSDIVLRGVLCAPWLFACGESDDTVQESDADADFASYRTFALATPPASGAQQIPGGDEGNLNYINDQVKKNLESLGLTEDASGSPDVIAFSLISTKDATDLSWNCLPEYWYGNWDWSFDPCALMAPLYTSYESGTFAVGLVDPQLAKVVFGGVGEQALVGSENAIQRSVEADVDNIFKAYPAVQTGN
jgi:hypothetical protein